MPSKIIKYIFLFLIFTPAAFAGDYVSEIKNDTLYGTRANEKFSIYQPTYFIFGKDDLKLQFSFKYKLAKSIPLYFGLTQTMFWNIYDGSKPFKDINYFPETFYRFFDKKDNAFKTLDVGYMHSSNGKKDSDSRSVDRVFLRTNYLTHFKRHDLDFNLMLFNLYNPDPTNADIRDHLGFWDLKLSVTKLLIHEMQSLDLELRLFAGSKVFKLNQGAYQVGLNYNLGSANLNPSLYLQRYEGFAEHLLHYKQRHSEYRLGFLFAY